MKARYIQFALVLATVFTLTSCPPAPDSTPKLRQGVWLFQLSCCLPASTWALELLPGGATATPDPFPMEADTSFSGELVWAEEDPTFLMYWDASANEDLVFIGDVLSPTSMEGVMRGTSVGTWSATWLRD